jgi:hypothetical protein
MPSVLRAVAVFVALTASGAAANLRSAKDTPVPPIYPIGVKNETFPRTVGTLFEVDGKVQYLSGWLHVASTLPLSLGLTVVGCNAWWLGKLSRNDDVDTAMKQIADVSFIPLR